MRGTTGAGQLHWRQRGAAGSLQAQHQLSFYSENIYPCLQGGAVCSGWRGQLGRGLCRGRGTPSIEKIAKGANPKNDNLKVDVHLGVEDSVLQY